ncbi:S-layer homology domain-containing protein [Paenibacillus sp. Marseille-P2973]|uniref:S-layer homology domain-containing protein n=1 Tax=Paenibacillus sp. Marseille-P2973 TaxID=1871032 RepID=UPI001B369D33|nr:S-layer homology domain-containing protein [Paenibacillus sp. Marseille-P2973]MBQ4899831.1 S-layer homology domain-containing protein [Paenibacillus sp. Marseille-P2973]
MIHRIHGKANYFRQTFLVFTVLCLLLVPFRSVVLALPASPVSVEVGAVSGAPGDTVDVPVTIDPGDEEVLGYDLDLNYDRNVLELVSQNAVTYEVDSLSSQMDNNMDGTFKVFAQYFGESMSFLEGKQKVFVIHFKIKENAPLGESTIGIPSGTYTDNDAFWSNITQLNSGTVTVGSTPTVKVGIGTASGVPGETVNVPVSILESTGSTGAYGMQLDYDPDALEVENVTGETGDHFMFGQDGEEGWVKVAWVDAEGGDHALEAGDPLFHVTFKIKENAQVGDTAITVGNQSDPDHLTFTDIHSGEMEKTVVDGKVTVNAPTNAEAPVISGQPQDQTVSINGIADLSVSATASGALSYQWYSNTTNSTVEGTMLTGATNATFTAPTGTTGTTYYYVEVTNTDPSMTGQTSATVTSAAAKVSVNALTNAEAPVISAQPQDRTVSINGIADLSVTASASGALSYQWYSNTTNSTVEGTPLTGATNSTFTTPTGTVGTTYYYVEVTNTDASMTGQKSATVTSSVAKVSVNALTNAEAPVISAQPEDRTVSVGGIADLSVTASASGALSYQWYSNTTNSTVEGTPLTGATNSTFTTPTGTVGTTYYYVEVTNTDASMTGQKSATVTSSVAKVSVNALTNAEAPVISAQPEDRTVSVGGTVDLGVTASASGTLSYQWYSNTTNSTTDGTPLASATSATYSAPTDIAGTTYYYVVVTNTDLNMTGQKMAEVTSSIAQVTVNTLTNAEVPAISAQPVDRTVNVGGTADLSVTATTTGNGILSYQWYSNTSNSTTDGTLLTGETNAMLSAPTGTAGTTYYYVVVTNTDLSMTGEKTSSATSSVVKVTVTQPDLETPGTGGPGETGGTGGTTAPSVPTVPSVPTPSKPSTPNTNVEVWVNGKVESAGTAQTTQIGDKKMVAVTVDPNKLEEKLSKEGKGATVTIPILGESNIAVGGLNGQIVKNMENQQATLVIRTNDASYTLPASQINIDAISAQIGSEVSLQDIKVQVKIAEPAAEMVKLAESASEKGTFELVVSPVEFSITGTYGGKTIDVAKFNAYVERTIALPEGVDPSKVTTAVVVEPDGTVRHVPTQVTVDGGKYYAKINSLTNSTYSVIWHPITFQDVEHHWAKEAVNDMGSRMVISGVGNGQFNPDKEITRAEFAAIMVRGLGLKAENNAVSFSDVKSADWYSSFVGTAQSYNLINGFEDGTFRPTEKITREQAMVILAKAIKLTGLNNSLQSSDNEELLGSFKDSSVISSWAAASIADCLQADIVSGRSDLRLDPKAPVSRAEVAVMVQRLLEKSGLI